MKILKKISVGLLALAILVVLVSFFLPTSYDFNRSIVIEADAKAVFEQVDDFKNWETWSPWRESVDSYDYEKGPTSGNLATSSWKSESEGDGEMHRQEYAPHDSIINRIVFLEYGNEATGYWRFEEADGATKVTWGIRGELKLSLIHI